MLDDFVTGQWVVLEITLGVGIKPMRSASAVECDVPLKSALQPKLVAAAYFRDSYCAPLKTPPPSVVDIFFGIFGHHPRWIKVALLLRNRIARLSGLAVPADSDILMPSRKDTYKAGDIIGPWPVFSINDYELIAGRDNGHLDFRLSIFRQVEGQAPSVVVSTVCIVHNWTGRIYLFFIVPFHKWGVRYVIARALRDGRL